MGLESGLGGDPASQLHHPVFRHPVLSPGQWHGRQRWPELYPGAWETGEEDSLLPGRLIPWSRPVCLTLLLKVLLGEGNAQPS